MTMTSKRPFGRRDNMPSTLQILHELLVFSAHEDERVKSATPQDAPKEPQKIELAPKA